MQAERGKEALAERHVIGGINREGVGVGIRRRCDDKTAEVAQSVRRILVARIAAAEGQQVLRMDVECIFEARLQCPALVFDIGEVDRTAGVRVVGEIGLVLRDTDREPWAPLTAEKPAGDFARGLQAPRLVGAVEVLEHRHKARRRAVIVDVGVGIRVLDKGGGIETFVELHADAAGGGNDLVAVLLLAARVTKTGRRDIGAVGCFAREREEIVDISRHAAGIRMRIERAERSALDPERRDRRFAACLRDDVDDAAHRLAAVKRRLRSAHHFNPLHIAERNIGKIGRAARRGGVIDRQAVDHHQRLIGTGAAREDRCLRAARA